MSLEFFAQGKKYVGGADDIICPICHENFTMNVLKNGVVPVVIQTKKGAHYVEIQIFVQIISNPNLI